MHASVWVVEDDTVTRDALVHVINAMGWAATGFDSAQACLAQLARAPPACILTDLNMPAMNGAAMIETLRADGAKFPIIAITAVGDDSQLARRARAAGITALLTKPIIHPELQRLLSGLLAPSWTSWKLS